MFEYKDEILSSRVGSLGASDANLIASVASSKNIPRSANKRLAVAKGLIEPKDGFKTEAMQLGDDVEMAIYSDLKEQDERWQSNYKLTSKRYSKSDLSLIAHIDFFLKDDENKIIRIVECKATKSSTMVTHQTYKNQLYVEYMLAKEFAASLGKKWRVKMALCHYDTNDNDGTFNPDKITLKNIMFPSQVFDIDMGMTLLNDYVKEMDVYYDDDEINADALPAAIKQQFDMMTNIIKDIKTQEQKVDEFKKVLYEFFLERWIKSVKSDDFNIVLVEPTTVSSFDSKRYLEDYEKAHPYKCRKIKKQYEKKTNRKGFVQIKIKN